MWRKQGWLLGAFAVFVTLLLAGIDLQIRNGFSIFWTVVLLVGGLGASYSLIELDKLPM
jgi:hypothetical protein